MGVQRQSVVSVLADTMKFFARFFNRVDVHYDRREIIEMVH